MKKNALELCAGFGGALQEFEDWDTLSIDNNPDVLNHPDFLGGRFLVLDLLDRSFESIISTIEDEYTFIWASPPCHDFSHAFDAPKAIAARNEGLETYTPDTRLVERCFKIIQRLAPQYWCIENVVGSIRYLRPILGEPRQIVGPYVFWGNFPLIDDSQYVTGMKQMLGNKYRWCEFRSNRKAVIPRSISKAFKKAIETQRTLF